MQWYEFLIVDWKTGNFTSAPSLPNACAHECMCSYVCIQIL